MTDTQTLIEKIKAIEPDIGYADYEMGFEDAIGKCIQAIRNHKPTHHVGDPNDMIKPTPAPADRERVARAIMEKYDFYKDKPYGDEPPNAFRDKIARIEMFKILADAAIAALTGRG